MNRGAKKLARWLRLNDVNQSDLAAKLTKLFAGKRVVSQSTVSAWATGKQIPHGLALIALNKHCGVPLLDWLKEDAERRTGEPG